MQSVLTYFVWEKNRFWDFQFSSVLTCFVWEKDQFQDFQFSRQIRRFWAFFEKIFFLEILQVFWPILYEKINFKIFSFLNQSDDSEHFLKAIISECFAQLLSEMQQLVGDSIKFAMKLYKKGSINEKIFRTVKKIFQSVKKINFRNTLENFLNTWSKLLWYKVLRKQLGQLCCPIKK